MKLNVLPPELGFLVDEVKEYDIPGLEFDEPPVILDIGACIGAFAVWAEERWPGASVLCYEPHPDNLKLLHQNVKAWQVVRCAVGAKSGTATLFAGRNSACHSLSVDGPGVIEGKRGGHTCMGNRDTSVPVLGAHLLPPCDILKVDTEGSEVDILQNYPHLAKCQAVVLEWHSKKDREQLCRIMADVGFVWLGEDYPVADIGVMRWLPRAVVEGAA